MTTTTQTAKMIYQQEPTAKALLTKLSKANPDRKYEIHKVASGWQIVLINKLPDYVPPAIPVKPLVVTPAPKCPSKTQPTAKVETMSAGTVIASAGNLPTIIQGKTCLVEGTFLKQTPSWFSFALSNGKAGWFHKNKVIGYNIADGKFSCVVSVKDAAEMLKKYG